MLNELRTLEEDRVSNHYVVQQSFVAFGMRAKGTSRKLEVHALRFNQSFQARRFRPKSKADLLRRLQIKDQLVPSLIAVFRFYSASHVIDIPSV